MRDLYRARCFWRHLKLRLGFASSCDNSGTTIDAFALPFTTVAEESSVCLLIARWFLVFLLMQLRVPDIGFGRRMNFKILRGNSSRRNPTCDS
jgi:hypothetical protein